MAATAAADTEVVYQHSGSVLSLARLDSYVLSSSTSRKVIVSKLVEEERGAKIKLKTLQCIHTSNWVFHIGMEKVDGPKVSLCDGKGLVHLFTPVS
eukprot:jgi/Bigna1/139336/aug1.49_g14044